MNTTPATTQSKRPQERRGSLAVRMIGLLLPITIIPTILMGIFVYNRARGLMLEQISSQMDTFLEEATNQLDSWLLDRSLALETLPRNQEFIAALDQLLVMETNDPDFQSQRNQTLQFLRDLNPPGDMNIFNHYLIILPDGKIVLSTNRAWEASSMGEFSYFIEKIDQGDKATFIESTPSLLYDSEVSPNYEVTLFSSLPLLDQQNNLTSYLVGISEGRAIQTILEANASFLPNNKLFLLNDSDQFVGITDLTKSMSIQPLSPSPAQLNMINAGVTESDLATGYRSYDNARVLGSYNFHEALNTGFLVEVPEADILGPINSLGPTSAIVISLTIVLIGGLILWVARLVTNPIRDLATITESFAHGDWEARSTYSGRNEIGLLSSAFNQMAEDLSKLYTQMEATVEERTRQVIATSEVSTMATSASGLDELLDRTSELISERFNYFHIAIYLLNSDRTKGTLRAASGHEGRALLRQGHEINVDRDSIYDQVIRNNDHYIVDNRESADPEMLVGVLPEANSKIALPISIGKDVFGIIDVQSVEADAFTQSTSSVLKTLANQLAGAIYNFQLQEGSHVDLQQINQIYLTSQRLAMADTTEEIFNEVTAGIQQTTYFAAFYRPVESHLELVQPEANQPYYADQLPETLNVSGKLASTFFSLLTPIIIKDLSESLVPMRPELLYPPRALDAREAAYIPIMRDRQLLGLIVLASRESDKITLESLQPYRSLADLVQTKLEKVATLEENEVLLQNLLRLNEFNARILHETSSEKIYPMIHDEIKNILGNVDFYVALYDPANDRIEIPYLYEGETPLSIEAFPLGEGLSSIVIRTKQPLMLIENTEERARALGAKIVGSPAKSWIGVPLMLGEEVIGVLSVQDVEHEHRFDQNDLELLVTLSPSIGGAIHSTRLLSESNKRAFQLETSAEIARETSTTLDRQELLRQSLQLVQDRFGMYHASIFILDPAGEFAVVEESTGEAGKKMIEDEHKLAVGSQSIIGHVTEKKIPLVVNDVTAAATHRFNPLLPDTRSELGIPILLGDKLIGALDVQSTEPYAFREDDIEVLQILANQLAVAINNANLFAQTQEHLSQHRLIHHITTVAAASTTIDDALSGAAQGLRVTLGDNVSILLLDNKKESLQVMASSGYENAVDGMQIKVGEGITGWVAQHNEALVVNNVHQDTRYIAGKEGVRSEIAVPLAYRGEILGVLNIESETPNAFDEHDQDILGTLSSSLAAILVNARLAERQQNLFEITNKIRQSVHMDTILETTATELSKALQTRRTRIMVGGNADEKKNGNSDRKEGQG